MPYHKPSTRMLLQSAIQARISHQSKRHKHSNSAINATTSANSSHHTTQTDGDHRQQRPEILPSFPAWSPSKIPGRGGRRGSEEVEGFLLDRTLAARKLSQFHFLVSSLLKFPPQKVILKWNVRAEVREGERAKRRAKRRAMQEGKLTLLEAIRLRVT